MPVSTSHPLSVKLFVLFLLLNSCMNGYFAKRERPLIFLCNLLNKRAVGFRGRELLQRNEDNEAPVSEETPISAIGEVVCCFCFLSFPFSCCRCLLLNNRALVFRHGGLLQKNGDNEAPLWEETPISAIGKVLYCFCFLPFPFSCCRCLLLNNRGEILRRGY